MSRIDQALKQAGGGTAAVSSVNAASEPVDDLGNFPTAGEWELREAEAQRPSVPLTAAEQRSGRRRVAGSSIERLVISGAVEGLADRAVPSTRRCAAPCSGCSKYQGRDGRQRGARGRKVADGRESRAHAQRIL